MPQAHLVVSFVERISNAMPSTFLRTHLSIVVLNSTITALLLTGTAELRAAPADELIATGKAGMEGGGQADAVGTGDLVRRSKDQLKAVTAMATAVTSAPTQGTAFSPNPLSRTTPPR